MPTRSSTCTAAQRWSRTNIVFFSDGSRIALQPFLFWDPEKPRGPLYDADGLHRYPEILELGVVQLEIHLGQSLENYLNLANEISNYDELWLHASKAFHESQQNFLSIVYRDAISKCLKIDFSISSQYDDEQLRNLLFRGIVAPLETELAEVFKAFISLETFKAYRVGPLKSAATTIESWTSPQRNVFQMPRRYSIAGEETLGEVVSNFVDPALERARKSRYMIPLKVASTSEIGQRCADQEATFRESS